MKRMMSLAFTMFVLSACQFSLDPTADQSPDKIDDATVQELSKLAREASDPDALAKYAAYPNEGVRSEVAKNKNLPENLQKKLSTDKDWLVRDYLAANERLSASVAAVLSKDTEEKVRWVVAKNPNVPETILATLVEDKSAEVQKKLADNTAISKDLMLMIAEKGHEAAVIVLLGRRDIPDEVLVKIQERSEESIKKALAESGSSPAPSLLEIPSKIDVVPSAASLPAQSPSPTL